MPIDHQLGRALDMPSTRRLALGLFGSVLVILILRGGPLAWDEAVYSALGHDLATSGFDWGARSSDYWSDVRAPGLPAVQAAFFWVLGSSDVVARLPIVLASVTLLAIIARTLDLVSPPRVGTTAVVLTSLCPGFAATSTLAFADHAAALAVALAVMFALLAHTRQRKAWLWAVPILLGLATTIRFGAMLMAVAPLAVVSLLIVRDAARLRSFDMLRTLLIAGVASVVVVLALLNTRLLTQHSSPTDATRDIVDAGGRPVSQGFRDLATILTPGPVDYGFNGPFWGWTYASLFGVSCAVALVRLVVLRRFSVLFAILVLAVTPFVLYSLSVRQFVTTYASPLFAGAVAAISLGLWTTRSVTAEEGARSDISRRYPLDDAALLGVTVFVALAAATTYRGVEAMHDRLEWWEPVVTSSIAARGAMGADCTLVTGRVPQVAWYSECTVHMLDGSIAFEPAAPEAYISAYGERIPNREPGTPFGFVFFDGVPSQPDIDDVWPAAVAERSIILNSPSGRRAALIVVSG